MSFSKPIAISLPSGMISVGSATEAHHALTERWPPERGPRHRDAVETCLKVIDGHRSSIDAENALRAAAEEAGIAVG